MVKSVLKNQTLVAVDTDPYGITRTLRQQKESHGQYVQAPLTAPV